MWFGAERDILSIYLISGQRTSQQDGRTGSILRLVMAAIYRAPSVCRAVQTLFPSPILRSHSMCRMDPQIAPWDPSVTTGSAHSFSKRSLLDPLLPAYQPL